MCRIQQNPGLAQNHLDTYKHIHLAKRYLYSVQHFVTEGEVGVQVVDADIRYPIYILSRHTNYYHTT